MKTIRLAFCAERITEGDEEGRVATETAGLPVSSRNIFTDQTPGLLWAQEEFQDKGEILLVKKRPLTLKLAFKSIMVEAKDRAAKIYSL